jgi:hypothetical protein
VADADTTEEVAKLWPLEERTKKRDVHDYRGLVRDSAEAKRGAPSSALPPEALRIDSKTSLQYFSLSSSFPLNFASSGSK